MSLRHRVAGRFPSLVIARRNVSRAKLRSLLAAMSILVGVVAIGAIGAGGAAFKQSQLETVRDLGATNVYVFPGFDHEDGTFDRTDLREISETAAPADVVATDRTSMEVVGRNGRRDRVGVTYIDDPRRLYDVEAGSVPPDWRRSAVVSADFAAEQEVAVGDRVTLVREERTPTGTVEVQRTYRVVAVLADNDGFGVTGVYLPIAEAPDREYGRVRVTTETVTGAEATAERLRERFNGRKDRLLVLEFSAQVRLFKQIVDGINVFLAGLAAISLLVAGVSIANTMLMAVIKRREEIGVLRAVGYTRRDVVRILMVEAGLLGLLGAAGGLVVATAAAMVANAVFLGNPFAFPGESLLYLGGSVAFGVGTSLLAGVYPAWRAANERPVEALRG